jgi:hypothetical protein
MHPSVISRRGGNRAVAAAIAKLKAEPRLARLTEYCRWRIQFNLGLNAANHCHATYAIASNSVPQTGSRVRSISLYCYRFFLH